MSRTIVCGYGDRKNTRLDHLNWIKFLTSPYNPESFMGHFGVVYVMALEPLPDDVMEVLDGHPEMILL